MEVDLVSIHFLKPWNMYREGEYAGFTPDVAARLIEKEVAERDKRTFPAKSR